MINSKYDLVIRNAHIITHDKEFKADIGIRNKKIESIEEEIEHDIDVDIEIDAEGLVILPGLIDTHVHLNEPGREEWEGFITGTKSLAAGGVTTFFDMPLNSNPPLISPVEYYAKDNHAKKKSLIDYYLWGGVVSGNLQQIKKLSECGVIGFKAFLSNSGISEFTHLSDEELLKTMFEIAENNLILALHAENDVICNTLKERYIKEGKTNIRDFVNSRPIASEEEAIFKIIKFAEVTGCKTHILHLSNGDCIKYISDAKKRGVDITVETCPHYLSLSTEDFERIGAVAKCAPPLRDMAQIEKLWGYIEEDEIDIIGSDHSPSPKELKLIDENTSIFNVWGGISGAQTTLPILLEEGYFQRGISMQKIVKISSFNPSTRFGLYPKKGTIEVGSDADIVLIDLNKEYVLGIDDLEYRHKQSPYLGKRFRGTIEKTISMGKIVWDRSSK